MLIPVSRRSYQWLLKVYRHTNGALNITSTNSSMQGISISRFLPWIMQEIPLKSIKQPIRITIRRIRTAVEKDPAQQLPVDASTAGKLCNLEVWGSHEKRMEWKCSFPDRQWNNQAVPQQQKQSQITGDVLDTKTEQ